MVLTGVEGISRICRLAARTVSPLRNGWVEEFQLDGPLALPVFSLVELVYDLELEPCSVFPRLLGQVFGQNEDLLTVILSFDESKASDGVVGS